MWPRRAPKSKTNRELPLASRSANEEKICNVGARDQQHESDSAQENEERFAHIADDEVAEGLHGKTIRHLDIGRVAAQELLCCDLELGVCLLEAYAGLQASGGEEVVALILAIRIELEGEPHVGDGIGFEVWAKDPDDGVRVAAKRDRSADDLRIAAELPLPEAVAEDDNPAAVRKILFRREGAAKLHRSAEECEIVMSNVDAMNLFRHSTGEVEAWAPEVIGGDVLKDVGLLLPVVKFSDGGAGAVSIR